MFSIPRGNKNSSKLHSKTDNFGKKFRTPDPNNTYEKEDEIAFQRLFSLEISWLLQEVEVSEKR
jgi:hypothetical protein